MTAKKYMKIILWIVLSSSVLFVLGYLMSQPRERRAERHAQVVEIGRKILSYLNTTNDLSTAELLHSGGIISDNDYLFIKKNNILYYNPATIKSDVGILLAYKENGDDLFVFRLDGRPAYLSQEDLKVAIEKQSIGTN